MKWFWGRSRPTLLRPAAAKMTYVGQDTTSHPVETGDWEPPPVKSAPSSAKMSSSSVLRLSGGERDDCLHGTVTGFQRKPNGSSPARRNKRQDSDRDKKESQFRPPGLDRAPADAPTRWESLRRTLLGLYDMHGNVWEWVQDGWDSSYYEQFQEAVAMDPVCPSTADSLRVVRGGDWHEHRVKLPVFGPPRQWIKALRTPRFSGGALCRRP